MRPKPDAIHSAPRTPPVERAELGESDKHDPDCFAIGVAILFVMAVFGVTGCAEDEPVGGWLPLGAGLVWCPEPFSVLGSDPAATFEAADEAWLSPGASVLAWLPASKLWVPPAPSGVAEQPPPSTSGPGVTPGPWVWAGVETCAFVEAFDATSDAAFDETDDAGPTAPAVTYL